MDRERKIKLAKAKYKWQQQQKQESAKLKEVKEENAPQEPSLGWKALDYGLRGLDYAGGLTRAALAETADAFIEGDKFNSEDWKNAVKGKSPTASTIMDKFGVPKGASLSDYAPIPKNSFFDGNVRGVAGFGLDVATDPLTYITLGAAPMVKGAARVAATPLKSLAQKSGKALYKRSFNKLDDVTRLYNKTPISDIAWKYNIKGTTKGIQKQLKSRSNILKNSADEIVKNADAGGSKVDIQKIFNNADDAAKKIDPLDVLEADAIKKTNKIVQRMKKAASPEELMGGILPSRATKIKTSIYDNMPKSAWKGLVGTRAGQKHLQSFGKSFKEGVEEAVERSSKGAGKKLSNINSELGSILTTRKTMENMVKKAGASPIASQLDGALMFAAPSAFGMKQAAKIGGMPVFQTNMGKSIGGDSMSSLWQILANQAGRKAKEGK